MASVPPAPVQIALKGAWKSTASLHTDVSLIRVSTLGTRRERLGHLLSELQFLCGLLHCLFCLSVNFQSQGETPVDIPFNSPVLNGIAAMVKDIKENVADASDDILSTMMANVRFYRDLTSRIATFRTYSLSALRESLSGNTLPTELAKAPTVKDLETTLKEWMRVLNSDHYNRTMLEWASERGLVNARREFDPGYQLAATGWVKFTKTNFKSLASGISRLFSVPNSNNFIQWAAEFARATWPEIYDFDAQMALPAVSLVQDMSQGHVNSLHFAAMLGLEDIVIKILGSPASDSAAKASGFLGTPLYCALVGPAVLKFGCRPTSWGSLIVEMEPASASLIGFIIAKSGFRNFRINIPLTNGDHPVQLAHVAFVAATMLEDPDIFELATKQGIPLEGDFTLMLLSSHVFDQKAMKNPCVMSTLMAAAFDQAMDGNADDLPWEGNVICVAICDFMARHNLYFHNDDKIRLPFISTADFNSVVRQCVIDDQALINDKAMYMARLAQDERFNPDLPASNDDSMSEGTIVHLAVGGAHHAVLHELRRVGANFTLRDAQGRTPLMLAEFPATLGLLVLEYGVPTVAWDNSRQNIWHLAAATNDDNILQWLCENDPAKAANINAVNDAGRTPLGEALMCINNISVDLPSRSSLTAAAARLLLRERLVDVALGIANVRLREVVTQWPDPVLIAKLEEAGVTF
ncbi:ankyrin [Pochonia chlamydosporia 170]|uniref:Ankyrin n=1 Tax=Pochonia chlamydosporia 170 TaxID=1380566 RepID=A0A179FL95_METCM|nr:ankyrin [Pochonia chlamydosporia 170]OAQ65981.1 ankyrin [Pochonia chlamydosporia 170]